MLLSSHDARHNSPRMQTHQRSHKRQENEKRSKLLATRAQTWRSFRKSRLTSIEVPPAGRLLGPMLPAVERWWDQRVHYPPPPPSLPPPAPPLPLPASPEQLSRPSTGSPSACSAGSRLCEALQCADLGEHIVLNSLGLRDAQALCLVSHAFRQLMRRLFATATSLNVVSPHDASFATAAFVARQLPALSRLVIFGNHCIDLPSFRALAASGRPILVGHLDKESALFVGAILASWNCTLVTSDARRISLRSLRGCTCVRLRGVRGVVGLGDADLASLLGALSLNPVLEELDLCANPAPVSEWITTALADATRRDRVLIRHHRVLELPGIVRAAPSLESALMRGVALPGWLAPHAAAESLPERPEYCLPVPVCVAEADRWQMERPSDDARR